MKRIWVWAASGMVLAGAIGFGAFLRSLPAAPAAGAPAAISPEETRATLEALRPVRRARPVIAILGANGTARTETTDYLMPYGILRRADVAEVFALATHAGPVRLYPSLQVEPDATVAQFDARYPDGADYVVVPAMEPNDDPAALAWIRSQHAKGAQIIGVCAGATVVAAAGLLDARRATTHWYYMKDMLRAQPSIQPVRDRRFVVDGRVATTTGITASMPMMLTLIEAIGGGDKAQAVAGELGVAQWDARHASDAFILTRPFALTVLRNTLAFWQRESLGLRLQPQMDEVSLALVVDAWSRTYRSNVVTMADTAGPVTTRSGLRVWPDAAPGEPAAHAQVQASGAAPARVLDANLAEIGARYGAATAYIVAMQLEYPGLPAP